MGMSTKVVGFRPADEQWNKMKAAWDACEVAGVKVPDSVIDFFDDEYPDDKPGAEIDISKAAQNWSNEYSVGIQVDLAELPEGIRYLRFYNSW